MKNFYSILILLLFVTSGLTSQVYKTINCEVAGTVNSLLSEEEQNTVTNLTLTGNIDFRDLTTLNSMSENSLSILDLSGSSVQEYVNGTTYAAHTIHKEAFKDSKLETLLLPDSITTIEQNAFESCRSLTSITIPKNTSTIGIRAFYWCSSLTAINVADDNYSFSSTDGVLYNYYHTTLQQYPAGLSGAFSIPEGTISIADEAFYGCNHLTDTLIFPSTLQTIGKSAFEYCTGIQSSLIFPEGLMVLDSSAFAHSTNITGKITLPASLETIGENVFESCWNIVAVDILANVDTIPNRLFYECQNIIDSINIPEGVKVIGEDAFYNCQKLEAVSLPSSLKSIGSSAFYQNKALTSIELPASIVLYRGAFYKCSGLETLTINDYWTLDDKVFSGCSSLSTINCRTSWPPSIQFTTFNSVDKDACIVNVPAEQLSDYQNNSYWNTFSNIVAYDNGVDPFLVSSTPVYAQKDYSLYGNLKLNFNENVIIKKEASIYDNLSSKTVATLSVEDFIVNDSLVNCSLAGLLKFSTSYSIQFPVGFLEDAFGNTWPKTDALEISVSTSTPRSYVSIDFLNDEKENLQWKTLSAMDYYGNYLINGYWTFSIKGIPMRWYLEEVVTEASDIPNQNSIGAINMLPGSLTVDVSNIPNTIASINTQVWENNTTMLTVFYNSSEIFAIDTMVSYNNYEGERIYDYTPYPYTTKILNNPTLSHIDSVQYITGEGYVLRLDLEIIDLSAPVVNLGDDINICEGDSVKLDAGYMLGAEYVWNTGDTTQTIYAKSNDEYSVTVKNTLAAVSDTVLVTVLPEIILNLPDTIYGCMDEPTLITIDEQDFYNCIWTKDETIVSANDTLKAETDGLYVVTVDNGSCSKTDSVRVIYRAATLDATFFPTGIAAYEDIRGELYKRDTDNKFKLYTMDYMPGTITFDSIPAGEYILKANFVSYSFNGTNSYCDTYHDGHVTWSDVTPFTLTCLSDTGINFDMAMINQDFAFLSTSSISGDLIYTITEVPKSINIHKEKDHTDYFTKILLYNDEVSPAVLIASKNPDSDGNYSFDKLPVGHYKISIERTGYSAPTAFQINIEQAGTNIKDINFTIDETTQSIKQNTTMSLKDNDSTPIDIDFYPNPTHGNGNLKIAIKSQGQASVVITDITGKTIWSELHQLSYGNNTIAIATDDLQGLYLIKVVTPEGYKTIRIIAE